MSKIKTAHTPGLWKVLDSGRNSPAYVITSDIGVVAWIDGLPSEQKSANAKLIAAAPELLAACKALIGIDNPQAGEWNHVDYAKAVQMGRLAIKHAQEAKP